MPMPKRLVAAAALCIVVLTMSASASLAGPSTIGPKPADCIVCWEPTPGSLIVSGLGSVSISPHIAHVGQTITAKWTKNGPDWTPEWPVPGCKPKAPTCSFKAKTAGGWQILDVAIDNGTGPAHSQDAYAVVAKGTGVIQGYATDKSGQGVYNATVEAVGIDGTKGDFTATTGGDGFYNILVKPGKYRISPNATGSQKYFPASADRTVTGTSNTRVDFILQQALKVSLTLNHTSVPADGYQVVKGTITTTYLGKPAPDVSISLWPKSTEAPDVAVSTGAKATVCDSGGNRIWPGQGLTDPSGSAPTVTTDASGKYGFTLTVGTVPGNFEITAWAKDAFGGLVTEDPSSVSSDQTLTVTSLGTIGPGAFVDNFDTLAQATTQPLVAGLNDAADSTTQALAGLTKANPKELGGLAYATLATPFGAATLIYLASTPPKLTAANLVTPAAADLVLSPGQWRGSPKVPLTDLALVMQQGKLQRVPSFTEWEKGATVLGWNLTPSTANPNNGQFHYFGYGYPTTTPGACF